MTFGRRQAAQWSIAEIRRNVEQRGQPLVALVAAHLLPGHSPGEGIGDQPIVVIGDTPTGLVYSDPSFSSSLGYGLELSDADFSPGLAGRRDAPVRRSRSRRGPLPRAEPTSARPSRRPAVLARALADAQPATPQSYANAAADPSRGRAQ